MKGTLSIAYKLSMRRNSVMTLKPWEIRTQFYTKDNEATWFNFKRYNDETSVFGSWSIDASTPSPQGKQMTANQ